MRWKVYAMKKLGAIALLLSLGLFTLGCEKPKEGDDAGAGAAPAADAPADDAAGEATE
jgi:hypothetical protein